MLLLTDKFDLRWLDRNLQVGHESELIHQVNPTVRSGGGILVGALPDRVVHTETAGLSGMLHVPLAVSGHMGRQYVEDYLKIHPTLSIVAMKNPLLGRAIAEQLKTPVQWFYAPGNSMPAFSRGFMDGAVSVVTILPKKDIQKEDDVTLLFSKDFWENGFDWWMFPTL